MSDNTKISWTDSSWPVTAGCEHVSDGCERCYAARLTSGRLNHLPAYQGLAENGRFNGQIRLLPDRLDWPLKRRKSRKIFVADMSDLFYSEVPDDYIAQVFAVMAMCPQHTFQILTKRHARMRSLLGTYGWWTRVAYEATFHEERLGRRRLGVQTQPDGCALLNTWLGVSTENQQWADIRIPSLLDTPAAVRFISAEPLLGPIDLHPGRWISPLGGGPRVNLARPWETPPAPLDWVIVGGESGPGHRSMDIAWLESIVSQCKDAGVAVWVKQDSGPRAGQQGRIPDDLWIHEFPLAADLAGAA